MVVLGVEKSLSGKKWLSRPFDERLLARLVQKYDFPEILARILVEKGLSEDEIDAFLSPTLKNNLPNPETLKDVKKIVLLKKVIEQHAII